MVDSGPNGNGEVDDEDESRLDDVVVDVVVVVVDTDGVFVWLHRKNGPHQSDELKFLSAKNLSRNFL